MWLHIVIFVILLLLTVCSTLGWIHVENIGTAKGRKMFLVVALAGNITGGLLTWTKGGGQVFEDGYELKKEENAYEEKIYGIRGRRRNRQCLCTDPGKRTGKEDNRAGRKWLTKEEDEEQKLLEFVANITANWKTLSIIIFHLTGKEENWSGKYLMILPETCWQQFSLQQHLS